MNRTENARRHFDDHRPGLEVKAHQDIDRGRVRRQKQRASVHQVLKHADALVAFDASPAQPLARRVERGGGYAAERLPCPA
jgi:hypothetical protein